MAIAVYSFFKYTSMIYLQQFFSKKKNSYSMFLNFFFLNFIIGSIFFIILAVFDILLSSLQDAYRPYFFLIIVFPYFLYLYFAINISHSSYFSGKNFIGSLKNGFFGIFLEFKKYLMIIIRTAVIVAALFALLWVLGKIIQSFATSNYQFYQAIYYYFQIFTIIIFYVVAYLLIFLNRIEFYKNWHKKG